MPLEPAVLSRHLKGSSELLLLIPVQEGFVPTTELISHGTRLRQVLSALFELRKVATERDLREPAGPVERLRTIHRVQWTVLEHPLSTHRLRLADANLAQQGEGYTRLLDRPQLLVSAHFDSSWEDYFHRLVNIAGDLLDLIFSHCEGYDGHSCLDGFEAFSAFLRRHQVPCDFLFANQPDRTVDDLRYLRKLATTKTLDDDTRAALHLDPLQQDQAQASPPVTFQQRVPGLRRAALGLFDLRERMFSDEHELTSPAGQAPRTGLDLFDRAVSSLLRDDVAALGKALGKDPENAKLQPKVFDWLSSLVFAGKTGTQPGPAKLSPQEASHIQGGILTPFTGMSHGCTILVSYGSAQPADFLAKMLDRVTFGRAEAPALTWNLHLTYSGLQRLGMAGELLSQLPEEFREGMEERAGLVGDLGSNHPTRWSLPARNWPSDRRPEGDVIALAAVDAVVVLQGAPDETEAHDQWHVPHVEQLVRDCAGVDTGIDVLHVRPLVRHFDGPNSYRDHFGYLEGAFSSQPVAHALLGDDDLKKGALPRDLVPLGELILGYPDARGRLAPFADPEVSSEAAAIFKYGTFLVLRNLHQDVAAFNAFVSRNAKAGTPADIRSVIVGRNDAGHSLVVPPPYSGQPDNDFDYASDPNGERCPFHAHMRRAHPRDPQDEGNLSPRIMRRGFAYGTRYASDPLDLDRGLIFMAYNASIARQFEVIQRWINGGNSSGILSTQNDLLAGAPIVRKLPYYARIGDKIQELTPPERPPVKLLWGLYLFTPSKPGLERLAEIARLPRSAFDLAERNFLRGKSILDQLDALASHDAATAIREWKRILEERANRGLARDVWFAIARLGGLKRTPYGFLVASEKGAREVLGDDGGEFSVREYWHRLLDTSGEHYLGFDRTLAKWTPANRAHQDQNQLFEARNAQVRYDDLAQANGLLRKLESDDVRARAVDVATRFLDAPGPFERGVGYRDRAAISVLDLARIVVGRTCQEWLDMPRTAGLSLTDPELVQYLDGFVLASRNGFQPHPSQVLRATAADAAKPLFATYASANGSMAQKLRTLGAPYDNDDTIKQALIGAVIGFAAPALGCIASVVDDLIESGDLFRMAPPRDEKARGELLERLLQALFRGPVPSSLYRTAMPGATVCGQTLAEGELVVVGLSAAGMNREGNAPPAQEWLFGGNGLNDGGGNVTTHGCPARHVAIQVIAAVVEALLDRNSLKREGTLQLSYDIPKDAAASAG